MDHKKYNDVYLREHKEAGESRVIIENNVLALMLNGFPHLKISSELFDTIAIIHELGNIETYLDRITQDSGYYSFTDTLKETCRVIAVLYALERRGLVTINHCYSDGSEFILMGKADIQALQLSSVVSATRLNFEKEFSFTPDQVSYVYSHMSCELTQKGYDVALALQKHADDERRSKESQVISAQAVAASQSSARTAKYALFAAAAIALGSIGNLAWNILTV